MMKPTARQKMRWMLRTKVVDDTLIVVIGSLALLYQALDLDYFRRNGHGQKKCGAVSWDGGIGDRSQQDWREFPAGIGRVGHCAEAEGM